MERTKDIVERPGHNLEVLTDYWVVEYSFVDSSGLFSSGCSPLFMSLDQAMGYAKEVESEFNMECSFKIYHPILASSVAMQRAYDLCLQERQLWIVDPESNLLTTQEHRQQMFKDRYGMDALNILEAQNILTFEGLL